MQHVILAQLDAAEASIKAARVLMEAWANGPAAAPEAPEESPICRHENRISLATHGKPKAWMCRDCGFKPDEEAPDA